jgi:UMF1 family MFS transporter
MLGHKARMTYRNKGVTGGQPTTRGLFAWALYDWANSSFSTVILTFVFAAYFTRQVAPTETAGSSNWGLAVGTAGIAIAVLGPVLGAIADQKGRRKPWLGAFTFLCVAMTGLLWFVKPETSSMRPAMILVWFAILGAELAAVFYNAMLPALAGPERVGRWSGWGWGLGYIGGLACLALSLLLFVRDEALLGFERETAGHVRATFVFVAVWFAVFSLPLFLLTPDEPKKNISLAEAVRKGLGQLGRTLRDVREYMTIVRFLIARMIYIDGLATVFAFGGVYAAGTFGMSEQKVLLFGITLNVTAGLGAFVFSWVDDKIGSRRTILFSLVGLLLPGIAMLFVESTKTFWLLGLILGIFVGPVQAASRSYLARAAPDRLRNQMFGLYALSGKATAFAGPLAVGGLTALTGNQRIGMSAIMVLLFAGLILTWTLPPASEAQ